nr:hypothetical protein [Tanacetum cinerariifolium]
METQDTLSPCLNSDEQQMQQIQDKAKKSCMVSFRLLRSHLKLLSDNDLKGTRTECGFKRAFATLFGQDVETFTGTMFINMDQLEKQLDEEEFQEIGSMAAFKILETQFQTFIKLRIYLDDEYVIMTRKALHKRDYGSRVNEKQMQTTEEKVDTSKALDASLVDTESSKTKSGKQDTSSSSGNDAHADDANIKPIYNEETMAEVNSCAKVLSNKITNRNKPIEQISIAKKLERQIPTRHSSELRIHDHNNEPSSSKLVPKVVPPADKTSTSQQELELLISPMYEEYFNAGNLSVSKSFALFDNLQQHDTQPTTNIHPTSQSINPPTSQLINLPTNVNAERNI